MASFKPLDKRIARDEKELHDFLWSSSWTGDRDALLANLVREGRELDAFLEARGKLRRNVEALARRITAGEKEGAGESLFELISHAYDLTAATEHVRKGDAKGAGDHLQDVMGSVTIGVCANAGCFEYVQEWEGGKTDFEAYMGKLADRLQAKGVPRAGEWKRIVSAAYNLGNALDPRAPKGEQVLLARAAAASAVWAAVASISIREALGSPPRFPHADFAAVCDRIAARL